MAELSVLIPCMNDVQKLPALMRQLQRICVESDIEPETLILDDASDDGTIAIAKAIQSEYRGLNIRVIHRSKPRRGYGALIRYGLAHATAQYCLIVPADRAHAIGALPTYLSEARRGAQLVQCAGCRHPEDGHNISVAFKYYQVLYRLAARLLVAVDIHDPTCSFKLVDRIYLTAIGIRCNGLAVIPEISFKTWLSGGKIVAVRGTNSARNSHTWRFRFLREGLAYTYVLLRAWWHRLGLSWF